jgi:hypothetical protein
MAEKGEDAGKKKMQGLCSHPKNGGKVLRPFASPREKGRSEER